MKRKDSRKNAARRRNRACWMSALAMALCLALALTVNLDKEENLTAASAETAAVTEISDAAGGIFKASDLFTKRDLKQTADLKGAEYYTLADGEDIHIAKEGVYMLTGEAKNATVYVEADSEAKVQLVLDGVTIENENFPCIYITGGDKVFVTTSADSALTVTGTFRDNGSAANGVIFSRCDLTLNGTAALTINSSENGVVGKDDLKVTGGTYTITAASKALLANDSIRVAGGALTLAAGTDGLHAENDKDDSKGYIYIGGGELTLSAGDDAIHAASVVQIDGGTVTITAAEGIEATYAQINGGAVSINARDDGINAGRKSGAYTPTIEINGGEVTVVMASGDTDGIDSNGDIYINGGIINVTGGSTFDYDGTAQYNGGTIIVNGQQIDSIPNQMMGGQMGGRGR